MKMEGMVAHAPGHGALLACGAGLIGLTLDAQVHDVVPVIEDPDYDEPGLWIRIDSIRIRIQNFCSIRIRIQFRIQAKTELSKKIFFLQIFEKSKLVSAIISLFSGKI
jgi:hypothetical protein